MSPAELVWRARSGVRVRLLDGRRGTGPAARFDDPGWRATVLELAERERDAVLRAAERIAAGELSLWGRRVDVDPEQPDWAADPLTGSAWTHSAWRGSGRDPKPIWELHRQQHLVPLAAGAALAGRADWGRLAVAQALDWTECNPPSAGIGWASGYEAAHRLVTWAFALPLVAEHADEAELARLGAAVADHRSFVAARPSRYSSANNHRLAELAGLLAGSHLTRGRPGWDDLWTELEFETARQTYGDGGSREQAAGYFLYVLEILWVCGLLARSAGRSLGRLEERLRAMLSWLAQTAGGDGEPPPVGDDAEDRMLRLDYLDPRRARCIAGRVAALLGEPPPEPATMSAFLSESGYAVLRTNAARIVFDVGELGFGSLAAHGHADALSVLVDRSEPLLRDTGTGSYVEGREDDRATAFHNTVVVDGESQAEPLGPHLWGRRYAVRVESESLAPELDHVRASHDGYRGARHTRSVVRVGTEVLVVLDRIRAKRPIRADLVWQPGPGLADGPQVASDPPAQREELPGRYSPRYTWTEPARRLVWQARGAEVVFASAVPLDGAELPEVRLERTGAAATVEVAGRRITEDWSAPLPKVDV
jgi:Heparinase II/III-like protein/Heparinase II/III N-terminus